MFDSVLNRKQLPRRAFGSGSLIGLGVYGLVFAFAIWASAHSIQKDRQDVTVKFVRPPPPPPPPPPPAPKSVKPKPKPPKPNEPVTVLQQAIVAPKEIPTEKPKEQEPTNDLRPPGEGGDFGDVANVAGGIVGSVIDATDAATPLEFDESVMTQVRLLSGPNPEYTQKALEHEVQGLMVVKCIVTSDGDVRDCRVVKSLPFMDRAVISALEKRHYKPAMLKGRPVTVDYTFRIVLQLPP